MLHINSPEGSGGLGPRPALLNMNLKVVWSSRVAVYSLGKPVSSPRNSTPFAAVMQMWNSLD